MPDLLHNFREIGMKVFKGVLFIIYTLLTIFVVGASIIIYQMSINIQNTGYAEFANTSYMLNTNQDELLNIPKGALISFVKSTTNYNINDIVICKNSEDELLIGKVTNYSNDADYVTYKLDVNSEIIDLPKLYVLGRADSYSVFLGNLMSINGSNTGRILCSVIPAAICIVILAFIIFIFISKRDTKKDEKRFTEKDMCLLNNVSRDRMGKDQNFEIFRQKKPFVNPNSHTELIKYDWLKDVADNAKQITQKEYQENKNQMTETEKLEGNYSPKKAETDKPDITPSKILSFEEIETSLDKKEKTHSKNERIINDMLKMLNQDKKD